jgi:hypothetical protein
MSELQEKLARRLSRINSTDTANSIEESLQRNKAARANNSSTHSLTHSPSITPIKLNPTPIIPRKESTPTQLTYHQQLNPTTPNKKEPIASTRIAYQLNPVTPNSASHSGTSATHNGTHSGTSATMDSVSREKTSNSSSKHTPGNSSSSASRERSSSHRSSDGSITTPFSTSAPTPQSASSSNKRSYTMLTKEEQADRDRAALIQRGLRLDPAEVKSINGRDSFTASFNHASPSSVPHTSSTYQERLSQGSEQRQSQVSSEVDAADITLEIDLHSASNTEEEESEVKQAKLQQDALRQQEQKLQQQQAELQQRELAFEKQKADLEQQKLQLQQQLQSADTTGTSLPGSNTVNDDIAVRTAVQSLRALHGNIDTVKKNNLQVQQDKVRPKAQWIFHSSFLYHTLLFLSDLIV